MSTVFSIIIHSLKIGYKIIYQRHQLNLDSITWLRPQKTNQLRVTHRCL